MKNSSFPMMFNRITFITRLIMNDENLTCEDIDSKWRDSPLCDGTALNVKQLRRDRERILELYNIDIQPRRVESGVYCYYIANKSRMKSDSVLRWTINTLATAETFAAYHSLRDRIVLEDYSPDPHLLPMVLQAMYSDKQISITYKRFDNVSAKVHSVEPFFIKDYQHRLYMVTRIAKKKHACVFALDRILAIKPLDTKFRMPEGLTAEEFFEDCFGVYRPDDMKTERITIRAYGDEMYYIDSKPLHHSQVAIGFLELSFGSCDFQLYLKPTNDFIGFLLSRAERIEVLEPLWLRHKLQSSISRSAKLYAEMEAAAEMAIFS